MNILLFGPDGQVGFELQRALSPLGNIVPVARKAVDLTDTKQLRAFIDNASPDMIVNAAAYTQVDQAESDPAVAHAVNAEAPRIMAEAAESLGAWFVHYSTDYVFDGQKSTPYIETDPVNPLNIYGKTKADGEAAIRATACRHLILRTSWVYSTRGKNFLRTILRLAQTKDTLNIVNDQIGAPTAAALIADVTALILYRLTHDALYQEAEGGTFHLTATGSTSWQGFAQYIIETTQATTHITGIPSSEYPTPAQRPKNSRLDTEKLSTTFNLQLPDWRHHVKHVLTALQERGLQ